MEDAFAVRKFRTSALQRRILTELLAAAEADPDTLAMMDDDRDGYGDQSPIFFTMRVRTLAERCYDIVPDRNWYAQQRDQRQALGRAIRTLIDRGLMVGYALCWMEVGPDGQVRTGDWAGGGRRVSHGPFRMPTPKIRTVALTREGLAFIRETILGQAAK